MRFEKPLSRLAGFMAYAEPGEQLPLMEIGEVWARSDWDVPWHTHQGWEIHLQIKGSSRWRVEDEVHEVSEKGLYLIRPGVRHRILDWGNSEVHFFYVVFPDSVLPPVLHQKFPWNQKYFFQSNAQRLLVPFQELIREVTLTGEWRNEATLAYLQVLSLEVSRMGKKPDMQPNLGIHPAAMRAKELMESRPEAPWRLNQLAQLSGVSVAHLIEIFRKEFGFSPRQFLLEERLKNAHRRLLSSDQSITQIAYDLGFSSSQHLATAFRHQYGCTPREVRKKKNL